MTAKRKRSAHRPDVDLRRQQARQDQRRHDAESAQAEAAARSLALAEAFRKHRRRMLIGWTLLSLGVLTFVTHMLEHSGVFQLFSPGLEDLLVGFPTAIVLVFISIFFLGQLNPGEKGWKP